RCPAHARGRGRAPRPVASGPCLALSRAPPPLPACCSRARARAVVLPSHADDIDAYVAAIFDFVREHPTSVILPAGDASCLALMPHRGQLAELGCVVALPGNAALEITLDKSRTLALASELGIAYPR